MRGDVSGVPVQTSSPPAVAPFRAQVDQPVGGADDVQVVLDHQQGVAVAQQPLEGPQQGGDVVEVQAGGGLVQQEQDAAARRPPLAALGQMARRA